MAIYSTFGTMSDQLFEGFSVSDRAAWTALVSKELKGADLAALNLWKESDGFTALPAYFREETEKLPMFAQTIRPLRFNQQDNDWLIAAEIVVEDIPSANRNILRKLAMGASAITIDMNGRDVARDEIDALLKDVVLEAVSISFRNEGNALRFQSDYYQRLSKRGLANDAVRGGLWFRELNADLALALLTDETHRGFGSLGLDGVQFYDEGANIPQQLAATLAWANEVLNGLRASGVSFEKISDNLGFALAIGPSFLPEVAKFRLIRFLWARILQQHGASAKRWRTWVHAETGKRHISHLDTPVNLLRENAQAMSAVIGGVDSLIVHPFRRNEEELAERLAINTQHLMKEEARLARVIDPAAGSYYVEHLTDIIGRHAWDLFKQIEAMGGYSAAVANGFLAETFEKTDAAYTAEVDKLERVVVGVNKYPTPFEGSNDQV